MRKRLRGKGVVRMYKQGRRDFSGANLKRANLKGAKVTDDQMAEAASFTGATMPDGGKHE